MGPETGATSERTAQARLGLPDHAMIDMGDFAGGMLKYLARHPVARVTVAGGIGKLAKLGQGAIDLHSARSQVDFAALAQLAGRPDLARCNTALEALTLHPRSSVAASRDGCPRAVSSMPPGYRRLPGRSTHQVRKAVGAPLSPSPAKLPQCLRGKGRRDRPRGLPRVPAATRAGSQSPSRAGPGRTILAFLPASAPTGHRSGRSISRSTQATARGAGAMHLARRSLHASACSVRIAPASLRIAASLGSREDRTC